MAKVTVRVPFARWTRALGSGWLACSGWRAAIHGLFVLALTWGLVASGTPRCLAEEAVSIGAARTSARISLDRIIDSSSLARKKKLIRWVIDQRRGTLLQRPFAVDWDGDALLVSDPGAGRVVRIDRRNRVKASPAGVLVTPMGISNCTIGTLVTDSSTGEVLVLDDDLHPVGKVAVGLHRPTGVVCQNDRVIVVETGRHRLVILDGLNSLPVETASVDEDFRSWGERGAGDGALNFPTVVALDGNRLWVGDTLNFRVQLLDALRGDFVRSFGAIGDSPGEMPRIKGLAVDSLGNLWVSDAHLDQIALFRGDGTFLTSLGGNGSEPGLFSFPAGIAAHPDGHVAIVDSLNQRIQIFRVSESVDDEGR